jgi:hypothetical protein
MAVLDRNVAPRASIGHEYIVMSRPTLTGGAVVGVVGVKFAGQGRAVVERVQFRCGSKGTAADTATFTPNVNGVAIAGASLVVPTLVATANYIEAAYPAQITTKIILNPNDLLTIDMGAVTGTLTNVDLVFLLRTAGPDVDPGQARAWP